MHAKLRTMVSTEAVQQDKQVRDAKNLPDQHQLDIEA